MVLNFFTIFGGSMTVLKCKAMTSANRKCIQQFSVDFLFERFRNSIYNSNSQRERERESIDFANG